MPNITKYCRRTDIFFNNNKNINLFGKASEKTSLIFSSDLRLRLPSGLFISGYPLKILYALIISQMLDTCPEHLIRLDLITVIIPMYKGARISESGYVNSSTLVDVSPTLHNSDSTVSISYRIRQKTGPAI
jgi:hypothetical protein